MGKIIIVYNASRMGVVLTITLIHILCRKVNQMDDMKLDIGDNIQLHLKKEDDGDVSIQLMIDGNEECGFWLSSEQSKIAGKKLQEMGDSD